MLYVSILTGCSSEMIVHPVPFACGTHFLSSARNHCHESLFSPSTTAHTNGYICSFGSLPTALSNIPPKNVLMKHPSMHKTLLHPLIQPSLTPSKHTNNRWNVGGFVFSSVTTQKWLFGLLWFKACI